MKINNKSEIEEEALAMAGVHPLLCTHPQNMETTGSMFVSQSTLNKHLQRPGGGGVGRGGGDVEP